MQSNSTPTSLIGLLISSAVLLGSLHAAQVIDDHKTGHDDAQVIKFSVDLHHHTDKSGATLGDQLSVDGRSLKLHRKHKARDAEQQTAWWRLHGLRIG